MSDPLDEIAELEHLRREAQALSRRLAAGDREAVEASARDPHEVVRVALAAEGRIDAVEVFPDWDRRVGADDLGPAIVAAADEAARRRAQAWVHGVTQQPTDDAADPVPGASPSVAGLTDPVDDSAVNYARSLFYVLRDSFAGLDELEREARAAALATSSVGGPDDRVRVTLAGDRLSGVTFDDEWLGSADAEQVGAAVTQAVHEAYAQRADATPLRGSWPYRELDRMAGDPAQLLASLGLAPRRPPGSA
ncbi:YbaB/EbfC family nucleoid-associated protein [Micromonospora sp. PLK6-60]|uniref:YbaB/EbfC family nucleoid-associated protein n=1 Tax=Micromonospora sp. PLK6-60 TaxID=2873383 RepID=UPI001CA7A4C8|nr:YbaB/EbfC family nucleoid-associated protein [Micromonospora sp. PLK6-60]MBY8874269.1 YbaB/EbfC family nucleoid-associated protein [Micromonospora sp. PLK6-60]